MDAYKPHSVVVSFEVGLHLKVCQTRPYMICFRQNLRVWAVEGEELLHKARLQREEGERLLDQAREHLPKVSQNVKTLRMYLDSILLARRQIELEREFGRGALRTPQATRGGTCAGGDGGVSGASAKSGGNDALGTATCCGLEVRIGALSKNTICESPNFMLKAT